MRLIKYYLYRLRWHLGFLTHLDLEINNTCNHKCRMCWHSEPLNFNLKVMDYDMACRILRNGRRAGLVSVKFNLRGEPTLHPRLPDIVSYARSLGYIDLMINTHGGRLRQYFLSLRDAGITTIIVSIGSMDADSYSKLHNVDASEYYNLHEGLEFAHNNLGNVKIKLNCHFSKVSNFDFDELKRYYPKFKIVKRYLESRDGEDISIARNRVRKKKCPHMHRRLTVHANGEIYPCCMSFRSQKDIKLGDSIEQALKSRKVLINYYAKKDFSASCKSCPSSDVYSFKK